MLISGFWVTGMSNVSVASGASSELAVTILVTLPPASISAWVTVYCAVKVVVSPGANVVAPPVGSEPASTLSSNKLIPVKVTFPVLVTR